MKLTANQPERASRMQNLRIALLVVLMLLSGTFAVMAAQAYLHRELDRQSNAHRPLPVKTVSVVVAKFAVERGESIGSDNMALRDLPVEHLPTSVVRPEQFEALTGMRLARPMRSGEPLLREALLDPAPDALATRLQPGLRAVTVVADEVNSVSGMLRPGDRIDLLFSARDPQSIAQGGHGELTRPLLQDVRVLATGAQLDPSGGVTASSRAAFGTITIEVTAEQAKMLVLAQRGGRLTALLRGPDDRYQTRTDSLEFTELLGRPRMTPKLAVAPVAQRPSTEMIIGGVGRNGSPSNTQYVGIASSGSVGGPEITVGQPQRSAVQSNAADRTVERGISVPDLAPGAKSPLLDTGSSVASGRSADRASESNPSRMLPAVAVPHLIR